MTDFTTASADAAAGPKGRSLFQPGEQTTAPPGGRAKVPDDGSGGGRLRYPGAGRPAGIDPCQWCTSSFRQTYITLDVYLDPAKLDKTGNRDPEELRKVTTFGYKPLIERALKKLIEERGIRIEGLSDKDVAGLISKEAPAQLQATPYSRIRPRSERRRNSAFSRRRARRRILQGPRDDGDGEAGPQCLARATDARRQAERGRYVDDPVQSGLLDGAGCVRHAT